MKILEEKILKEGQAIDKDILKVDSFLNQQVDVELMEKIGKEFAKHFENKNITKVATIESSGIAPATLTALALNVPLVIFKKQPSKVLNDEFYSVETISFTKRNTYNLIASKKYLLKDDNILIIDDFLANGEASSSAMKIVNMAGANVAGIGIVIEKSFQPGREKLEKLGVDVYSLARIKKLEKGIVEFI